MRFKPQYHQKKKTKTKTKKLRYTRALQRNAAFCTEKPFVGQVMETKNTYKSSREKKTGKVKARIMKN
jgi:hypothetical protein